MKSKIEHGVGYAHYNTDEAYKNEIVDNLDIDLLFHASFQFDIISDTVDLIKKVTQLVGEEPTRTFPASHRLILVFSNMVVVVSTYEPFIVRQRVESIDIYGTMENVQVLYSKLNEEFPRSKKNKVDWFYSVDKKPQHTTVTLKHVTTALDEFFPWIPGGLATFQTDFMKSDSNVLLLIGEPGCGKSSFIRDLISRNDLAAAVTYDEDLMSTDLFFIEFMNGSYDVLVIEDADVLLLDREGGNKVMNKLLNASDGLIHSTKKIIFTANITKLDDIDQALIRPGRCFEVLMFRELTRIEANIAAKAAGVVEPDEARTLAALFNHGHSASQQKDIGFTFGRH